jgi:hypothetical protein
MLDGLEGSSALRTGETRHPVGTLEELKEQGLDPAKVKSCHLPGPGVAGCTFYKGECPFGLKDMGGFRGQGPRYIGYQINPDEGPRAENLCRCFDFVASLRNRMFHGEAMRRATGKGEEIKIVAQEGEKIVTRVMVREDENDRSPNPRYKIVTATVEVPRFERPGESGDLAYSRMIAERDKARDKERMDERNGSEKPAPKPKPVAEPVKDK